MQMRPDGSKEERTYLLDLLLLLLELSVGLGKVLLGLVEVVLRLHHLLLRVTELLLGALQLLRDLADLLLGGIGAIESVVLKWLLVVRRYAIVHCHRGNSYCLAFSLSLVWRH